MINIIIVFFSLVVCCCMADVGKITIKVVEDSSSTPITNAYVTAGFNNYIKPGWGWGGGKPTRDSGYTDKNGLCTLSATCNDPSVGYGARKEGYYGSGGYSLRFTNTTGIVRKRWGGRRGQPST